MNHRDKMACLNCVLALFTLQCNDGGGGVYSNITVQYVNQSLSAQPKTNPARVTDDLE